MATVLKLSPDQADVLACAAATDASLLAEDLSPTYADPAGFLGVYDTLTPLARLVRSLVERQEVDVIDTAKEIVIKHLGNARESIGGETEALAHVRSGNSRYFNVEEGQEASERVTRERLDELAAEAVALKGILDLINGRSVEAVSA